MSRMCPQAACKVEVGLCTHEKTVVAVVALLAVGYVAARAFSLF